MANNTGKFSYIYCAYINNSDRAWKISFKFVQQVRANYDDIKKAEDRVRAKYGNALVHIWVYDSKIKHRWVGQYLTERQLKAHFGISLPPRVLRGESSPAMTDFLNDRGRDE